MILSKVEIEQLTEKYGRDWTARFISGTTSPTSEATTALARTLRAATRT